MFFQLPSLSLFPPNLSLSPLFFLFSTLFNQDPNKIRLAFRFGESNGTPLQYSCLENPMDGGVWWAAIHGVVKSQTRLRNFTFTFHFYALEKEMAMKSSVLAWRIPRTEEPGRLPSMGSHRVGHGWSDLAAAAAAADLPKTLPFGFLEPWTTHFPDSAKSLWPFQLGLCSGLECHSSKSVSSLQSFLAFVWLSLWDMTRE